MSLPEVKHMGCKEYPIRISSAPALLACEGFHVARLVCPEEAGIAAAIGTAADRAIKLWHTGMSLEEAVKKAVEENPTVTLDAVEPMVRGYAGDADRLCAEYGPVVLESQDLEVTVDLGDVHFVGHLDQARVKDGKTLVWDMKASRFGGQQLTHDYLVQLVLYAEGLRQRAGAPLEAVGVGGIIRLTDYLRSRSEGPVAYPCPVSVYMMQHLLQQLRNAVMRIRRGSLPACRPGSRCSYCQLAPPGDCVTRLRLLLTNACPVCGRPRCNRKRCREMLGRTAPEEAPR